MMDYLFDIPEGKLTPLSRDGSAPPGGFLQSGQGAAGQTVRIRRMSLEEFKELEGDAYPYKRNLYRSMNPVLYCKLETFGACIQGTMRIPRGNKGKISTQSFGYYLLGGELLLVEDGTLLKILLGKMEKGSYCVSSPSQLLLTIFELLIEDDFIYLGQQEQRLSDMEEQLLKRLPEDFHETIIQYRKQFQAYHSYYEQLINIGEQMRGDFGQELTKEERTAWQLYANRALRLHDHAELLREYLVQIRELYQSLMDVQQKKVMSILTVVTTIFLPLTLIAGWYGMNFPGMPEFHWRYAYPAVLLVSGLIIALEILFFHKKKML